MLSSVKPQISKRTLYKQLAQVLITLERFIQLD